MKTTVAQLNAHATPDNSTCEICGADDAVSILTALPSDAAVIACPVCTAQLTGSDEISLEHWRCLQDAIWSENEAVQILAWRLLQQIKAEPWAAALIDQMYLDDDQLAWAEAGNDESAEDSIVHKDSNGNVLAEGDDVSIIKDLEVKGAGFTAKRGTIVKNISLTSNPEQIEGRVNGTKIVLLTCFLKKSN
jgi:protein PhnA